MIDRALSTHLHTFQQPQISFISPELPNHIKMAHKGELPQYQRLITAHNDEGKAVFAKVDETGPWNGVMNDTVGFSLGYTTSTTPADMTDDKDIAQYKEHLVTPPGLVNKQGSVLRFVDCPPGSTSPMHRTVSLDYGVVLIGEMELVLDSGETRVMKVGDVAVQRGTNHAWRNTSDTEWARMMYVLQPSLPISINGKPLDEDLGHMTGVPASS
ncbi:hypothetical protein D6C83_00110 [Aureobasidium pullulans]|uniref:Cupin type-2 domain-containing protein n=1 Tax=Aureobasidium pullulans TaxID=5580 RepID=A0A4T0EQC8_AURPU|nr:hypothetical protein D6C83_00110 [Aureobasidium pullulans]